MATTPNGISFEELDRSPSISGGDDGMNAMRRFKVAWSDWPNFVAELKGVPIDTAGQITAGEGIQFPGYESLKVHNWTVEGFDQESPTGGFTGMVDDANTYGGGALVTASYKTPGDGEGTGDATVTVPEKTYLTYEGDYSSSFMTIPNRNWKWSGTGVVLSQDVPFGLLMQHSVHRITWHNVVRPPWTAQKNLVGMINSGTFGRWETEQLLYMGTQIRSTLMFPPTRNRAAVTLYDLTHTFMYRHGYSWNKFYNPVKDGGTHWQQIEAVDGGEKPYTLSASFATLFQYES